MYCLWPLQCTLLVATTKKVIFTQIVPTDTIIVSNSKIINTICTLFVIVYYYRGSPPIRMVPPAVAFLLGCTSGGTVSIYSTGIPTIL